MMLSAVMRRPARLVEPGTRPPDPLFAALFEDSGAGAVVLDRNRRIVRANRRLEDMLSADGTAPSPGLPGELLFAPADRPRVAAALASATRGNAPPPLQVRLRGINAGLLALSVAPLHEAGGGLSGLLLRLTDLSAEKRLEAEVAQLQKMQALGQLAGGIAHDFNNLLAAIRAAVDSVMEREDAGPATRDDVRQIRDSAERGAALVRQLLAFGRCEPLQPAVVIVNAAIRSLSDMLVRLLGSRIRLQLAFEEPGRAVRIDPTQFDQVLVNLAVNARDAMPDGGTLTLRTGHLTLYRREQIGSETIPPGQYVTIGVEDTGSGIPPDILARVFEPFFTTRRDRGGSGLGLATVRGIVRQSGGFVRLASTVGEGTSVTVWLPRYEEPEVVSAVHRAPAAAPRPPGPGPVPPVSAAAATRSVLLVEDEGSMRRLTERALQRAGWRVAAAESAEAALQRLPRPGDSAGPPSVLVSDVVLPGMDGAELVRTVRAIWPDLPAVLVSGYADSAELGDLAMQGVSFLAKPFALRDLVACVEQVARPGG